MGSVEPCAQILIVFCQGVGADVDALDDSRLHRVMSCLGRTEPTRPKAEAPLHDLRGLQTLLNVSAASNPSSKIFFAS